MKTIKLIPDNTSIRFMRIRVIAFTFSGLLILASIVSLLGQGLNFGIDFMGGTLIEAAQEDEIDISALRSRLNNLGVAQVQIQEFGTSNDVLIRISGQKTP